MTRTLKEVKNPMYAFNAGVKHCSLKGLDPRINPDKPPRNFGDAMKALDQQAWPAAYNSEYLGFKQREVFKLVKPAPGVRIHDTLTRLECVYAHRWLEYRHRRPGPLSPVVHPAAGAKH